MTAHPSPPDEEPGTAPDLEYDLAHEVPAFEPHPSAPAPSQGVTTTDDDNGDYGYDLAHDIPRT